MKSPHEAEAASLKSICSVPEQNKMGRRNHMISCKFIELSRIQTEAMLRTCDLGGVNARKTDCCGMVLGSAMFVNEVEHNFASFYYCLIV